MYVVGQTLILRAYFWVPIGSICNAKKNLVTNIFDYHVPAAHHSASVANDVVGAFSSCVWGESIGNVAENMKMTIANIFVNRFSISFPLFAMGLHRIIT